MVGDNEDRMAGTLDSFHSLSARITDGKEFPAIDIIVLFSRDGGLGEVCMYRGGGCYWRYPRGVPYQPQKEKYQS